MPDTYLCARNSGDRKYIQWLRDRLINVYGESCHVDYVITLENFGEYFNRRAEVPRWLNWILRKYNL